MATKITSAPKLNEDLYVAGNVTMTITEPVRLVTKTIRSLDPELYREVRLKALDEGVTVGEWINQAIKERLAKMSKLSCG